MSDRLTDLTACLRFWSRLPLQPGGGPPDLARAVRMLPVAGLIIASPAAAVLMLGAAVGLLPVVGATCALATLVLTTGALHEDGLADTVDGLFGGGTPERRLAIMRDSRIGTYGALALGFSLIVRIGALAAIASESVPIAATTLLAAGAVSRTAGLLPLACLRPARPDGLGAGVATPDRAGLQWAVVLSACALLLPVAAGFSVSRAIVAGSMAVCAAYLLVPLARAKIGGQTGDIAGASQQFAEIAFLIVSSAR